MATTAPEDTTIDLGIVHFTIPGHENVPCIVVGNVKIDTKLFELLYRPEVMISKVNGTVGIDRVVPGLTTVVNGHALELEYDQISSAKKKATRTVSCQGFDMVAEWADYLNPDKFPSDPDGVLAHHQFLEDTHHAVSGVPKYDIEELKKTIKIHPDAPQRMQAARQAMKRGEWQDADATSCQALTSSGPERGKAAGDDEVWSGAGEPSVLHEKKTQHQRKRRGKRVESERYGLPIDRTNRQAIYSFIAPQIAKLRARQVAEGQDPYELWLGQPIWAAYAGERPKPAADEGHAEDTTEQSS